MQPAVRLQFGWVQSMSSNRSIYGGSLVLFLLALPVIILLFGLAVQLGAYGVGVEQNRAAAKMVLLGASEAYYRHACVAEASPAECHQAKMNAASTIANQLASQNIGGALYPLSEGDYGATPAADRRLLIAGRYAAVKPPGAGSDPCAGSYPCFYQRAQDELSNAFKLVGKVSSNPLVARFERFFGLKGFFKKMSFDVTSAAVPMRMCAVIDLSGSIASDSHPEDMQDTNGDGETENVAPLFSYRADDQSGLVGDPYQAISAERVPDARSVSAPHIKSDYALINSVDLTRPENYDESFWSRTPDADSGFVTAQETSAGEQLYLLDLYRTGAYKGAEPWNSIMKGVQSVAQAFQARAVAGDRMGLVFFDKHVRWPYLVQLTGDFDHVTEILQTDAPGSFAACAPKTAPGAECELLSNPPAWVKLGLFPKPYQFSNIYAGLGQALFEFSKDDLGVPSTDFITLFSDGLVNCYYEAGQQQCRRDTFLYYQKGMNNIRNNLVFSKTGGTGLFKGGIALHMFMAGADVGPHTLLLDDGGKCLTDDAARKKVDAKGWPKPIDFVLGQGLSVYDPAVDTGDADEALKAHSPATPFYQTNADWYNLVRMTGGRWAPLRPLAQTCPDVVEPVCTTTPARQEQDPGCRSTEDQVKAYLEQILRDSSAFSIVMDK